MIGLILQFVLGAVVIAAFIFASVRSVRCFREPDTAISRQSLDEGTPWWEVAVVSRRMSIDAGICRVCQKPTTTHCGHCKAVKYCGRACQLQDWRSTHKFECPNLQKTALCCANSAGLGASSKPPPPDPNEDAPAPQQVLFPYQHYLQLSLNRSSCRKPPVGFTNLGNNCYANAALQCFLANKPLRAYLDQGLHSSSCNKPHRSEWCLLCELQVLCKRIADAVPGDEVSIRPLLRHLRRFARTLSYGRQEDAHEFFYSLLNTMEAIQLTNYGGKERYDMRTQETTLVHHVFGGYLRSQVICSGCGGASRRYEVALDLQLEVAPAVDRLEDALFRHTADEVLDGDNCYACDSCRRRCRATRSTRFEVAPNTLVLCLKRFGTGRFGKINKVVSYGEHLDLSPFMAEGAMDNQEVQYTLSGVVVHLDQMNSTSFGHYICFVRTADGRWYGCDDSHVAPTSITRVLSQNAYMLFYQRDVPKPAPQPGFKRHKPLVPAAITASSAAATAASPSKQASPVHVSNGLTEAAGRQQQQQQLLWPLGAEQLARVSTAPAALVRMAEEPGSSGSNRDEEATSSVELSQLTDSTGSSSASTAGSAPVNCLAASSSSDDNTDSPTVQEQADVLQQPCPAAAASSMQQVMADETSAANLPVVEYKLSRSGPELLQLKAQLPGVSSAAVVAVDVLNAGPRLQRLQLKVPGKFASLDVPLVQHLDGGKQLVEGVSGKFYKRKQLLRLNLHLADSSQQLKQHRENGADIQQDSFEVSQVVHWHSTDSTDTSSGSESDSFMLPHSSIRSVMSDMDLSSFLGRQASQCLMEGLRQQQHETVTIESATPAQMGDDREPRAQSSRAGSKKSSGKKGNKSKKRR